MAFVEENTSNEANVDRERIKVSGTLVPLKNRIPWENIPLVMLLIREFPRPLLYEKK